MLRHTGEITKKHAGKEEIRGRAPDKRYYSLYDPLDLSKVVTINRGDSAMGGWKPHEKDLEHRWRLSMIIVINTVGR